MFTALSAMKNFKGYTLTESLLTLLILGTLIVIVTPLLLYLLGLIRLNLATNVLAQFWKITRYDATGAGETPRTLCMSQGKNVVLVQAIPGDNCKTVTQWRSLPSGVSIDSDNSTLRTVSGVAGNGGKIYRVSWADTQGGLGGSWGQLGRLVLIADGTTAKRCLFLFNTDGSWDIREDQKCNK